MCWRIQITTSRYSWIKTLKENGDGFKIPEMSDAVKKLLPGLYFYPGAGICAEQDTAPAPFILLSLLLIHPVMLFSVSRQWLLILGFFTGLHWIIFNTPGLHAAACNFYCLYCDPSSSIYLHPKTIPQSLTTKSLLLLPCSGHLCCLCFVLTLLHHGYMLLLEWLSFGSFLDFIIRVVATTGINLLLILQWKFCFREN